MRKILFLLLPISLAGCASTQPLTVPKIQPSSEIMKDCGDWIIPENTKKSFAVSAVKNKETFDLCKKQNNDKKEFIKETTK